MHERSSEVLKTETDSPAVGFVSWLSFSVAPPNAGQRVYGGVKKKWKAKVRGLHRGGSRTQEDDESDKQLVAPKWPIYGWCCP